MTYSCEALSGGAADRASKSVMDLGVPSEHAVGYLG